LSISCILRLQYIQCTCQCCQPDTIFSTHPIGFSLHPIKSKISNNSVLAFFPL